MIIDRNDLNLKTLFTHPKYFWRELTAIFQRGINGFAPQDTWDLGYYFVRVYVDALKHFKKVSYSYPYQLTVKQWDKILDEMIEGFEAGLDAYYELAITDEEKAKQQVLQKKYNKAIKLFLKWHETMWY